MPSRSHAAGSLALILTTCLILVLPAAGAPNEGSPESWPTFRGPDARGVAAAMEHSSLQCVPIGVTGSGRWLEPDASRAILDSDAARVEGGAVDPGDRKVDPVERPDLTECGTAAHGHQ